MAENIEIPLTPEHVTAPATITVPPPPVKVPPPTEAPPPELPTPLPPSRTVPEALPDLIVLAGIIAALGLVSIIAALAHFLSWLIRFVLGPLWTRVGSPTITTQKLAQPLSNALGTYYTNADQNIGLSFNKLAGMTSQVGQAILAVEYSVFAVATRAAALTGHTSAHAPKTNVALQTARQARTAAAQTALQLRLDHQAALDRAKGLDARLQALETHVTTLIQPELDGLRHLIPNLEKGVTTAWDEIVKHGEALGLAAMTATTATALARLGAGYVACEANQLLGQATCRQGPNRVKQLLEGLFDIAALLDLCQLVNLIATAAESPEVTSVFTTLTGGIQDLIDCRGIALAAPLPQRFYAQPGVLTGYALPGVLG
jgi:hypothetical protein